GDRALARAGKAHDQHDVAVRVAGRAAPGARDTEDAAARETLVEPREVAVVEPQAAGARDLTRVLGPRGTGKRHHERREAPEPGQRDLDRRRLLGPGELAEDEVGPEPASAFGASERAMGQEPDAVGDAVLGHAVHEAGVVPGAHLDLDGRDVDDPPGL